MTEELIYDEDDDVISWEDWQESELGYPQAREE